MVVVPEKQNKQITGDGWKEKELEAKEMINMDGKENYSKLAKQHLVKRKKNKGNGSHKNQICLC